MVGSSLFGKTELWVSHDSGMTWTQQPANIPWRGRTGYSWVVAPDGSVIVMGGLTSYTIAQNDVRQLNPAGSTVKNPVHTYQSPGNYTVSLRVGKAGGISTAVQRNYITAVSTVIKSKETVGGTNDDFASISVRTADGGLLLVGTTKSTIAEFHGFQDLLVAKYDATNTQQWIHSYTISIYILCWPTFVCGIVSVFAGRLLHGIYPTQSKVCEAL
ncbi:MAG: hypothetical protein METHP_01475 [Methanoregula sp. SKADARSKE-2]|nr:MAG: hypothetical protein METHP_01475 [Methanoregula sp. SKADARSKE-2]